MATPKSSTKGSIRTGSQTKAKPSKLRNLLRKAYIAPAIVVLAVAGVGTHYLVQGHAATTTSLCYNGVFGEYAGYNNSWQHQCVKYIQTMSYEWDAGTGSLTSKNVDGYYGPGTVATVKVFQKYHNVKADGVVGPNTWRQLCGFANMYTYTDPSHEAAHNAGCPGVAY
jgi:peptidoglycan hydrolase-like protein with peptidoglycan-binding domain